MWFKITISHLLRARDPYILIPHTSTCTYQYSTFPPLSFRSQWLSSQYLVGGLTTLSERVRCSSSISGEAVTSLYFACGFPGRVRCSSSVSMTGGVVTFSGMASGLVVPWLPSTCPGPCATLHSAKSLIYNTVYFWLYL